MRRAMVLLILLLGFLIFPVTPALAAIQFLIFDPVISGLELSLTASVSGLTSSSCSTENKCYLQGTYRNIGATRYFGQTQNNVGSWIDYVSAPELEYLQSTFVYFSPDSGSWSGQLKMRYTPADPDYAGPGNYEVKVRRFSGKSTNPAGDSNTLDLTLTEPIPTPSPTPTVAPNPTSTQTPTLTPTVTLTPSPKITSVSVTPNLISPTASSTPEFYTDILGSSTSAEPLDLHSPTLIPESRTDSSANGTFFGVSAATVALLSLAFWRLGKLLSSTTVVKLK